MQNFALQFHCQPLEAWRSVCNHLKDHLPRQSYLTWFHPLEPISFENQKLILRVPSRFYSDWIEGHYNQQLRAAIDHVLGENVTLEYTVDHQSGKSKQDSEKIAVETNPKVKPVKKVNFDSRLNPHYRFENFIEGDCNRFARAAAIAITEKPGKTPFNPHLLYGRSGLGKTHLIQAIGNSILNLHLNLRVLYVTSEQFTADFVKSIKSRQSENFNNLYRSVDVLLLDDVQFFMAKEKTQEEFFHTFNSLHQMGKQLVFSSDRPPRELEGFNERLVSRLQWGLVSELHIPDFETRIAILKEQAEHSNISVPEEIIHFFSTNITDNVRTLQGALIHLLAQSSLLGEPLTLDLAKNVISNFLSRPLRTISIEKIQNIIAEEFDLPSDLIRSRTRKKPIAEARQLAMYLCTEYTKSTLKNIGMQFGGRDHTTVIHARERVNEQLKVDKKLLEVFEKLRRKIELSSL